MQASDLAQLVQKSKKSGDGYVSRCPAHDDNRESLSFRDLDGKIVLKCHTGCTFAEISAALKLKPSDFFHSPQENGKPTRKIIATYDYPDEEGTILFQAVRYSPKGFSQRRPDGKGGWLWNLKNTRRVLYRLPGLAGKTTAYITEGEKDADRLWDIGLCGTTAPQGAGKWRGEYADQLKAAEIQNVGILPDNDGPGRKHAQEIAKTLYKAFKVKIINLPGLDENGDVSNWLDAGGTVEKLRELAREAPPVVIEPQIPVKKEEEKAPDGEVPLSMGQKGPHNNINNALRILEYAPAFAGKVWFDDFFQRMFTNWGKGGAREWADSDDIQIAKIIQEKYGISQMKPQTVNNAAVCIIQDNRRNSPRDWMESLEWDGKERLKSFLWLGFGAENDEYHTATGKNFILGIVARTYRPGCKMDTMPVFEGPQGGLKSSALEAIASPEWFAETNESPDKKDFYLTLPGKLIIEISELDSFRKAEVTTIKKMLSCHTDRYRLPYAKSAQDFPRRGVFAGTTNHSDWHMDETGARRFWPVTCGEIDLEYIREQREQLFAEAVAKFKDGATWWEMPGDATRERQEKSRLVDSWEDTVREYIRSNLISDFITTREILSGALKIDEGNHSRPDQMRVGKLMRVLGWEKGANRVDGVQLRGWRRIEEDQP